MKDFNFDSGSENNSGDNQNDCFFWSEKNWRNFLNDCEKEIFRFLKTYNECLSYERRLDEVAKRMGWDSGWADPEEDKFFLDFNTDAEDSDEETEPSADVYTVHTQPVLIVSNGLLLFLESCFADLIEKQNGTVPSRLCWDFAISLSKLRSEILFAVNCIDAGDSNLAICHLKNALAQLNGVFEIISNDYFIKMHLYESFEFACRIRLFDLRELWIRLIEDCRSYADNNLGLEL